MDRVPRSVADLLGRPTIRPISWEPTTSLKPTKTVVVLPVGPGHAEGVADTLQSVLRHTDATSRCVVIVDDCTTDGTTAALERVMDPSCVVLRNDQPNGMHYLGRSLASAFTWCLDRLDFDLLFRLDTDALVIGPGIFEDAREHHYQNSSVGCFGRFDVEPDGSTRTFDGLAAHLRKHERRIDRPFYSPLRDAARAYGWTDGAHVFGAACFYTRDCLMAMRRIGALNIPPHSRHQHITEDLFFSMAVVASGFQLGHFAAPDAPLTLKWRDLPFSPEEHVRRGDKVVHSVDKGPRAQGAREAFRDLLTYQVPAGADEHDESSR